jgi:hypothetical protein
MRDDRSRDDRSRDDRSRDGRSRIARPAHLVGRFFTSLAPFPVGADDRAWVERVLTPPELELWARQSLADRRESVRVARRTEAALAGTGYAGDPRWLAAALLHDIGKLDARFGPLRRSIATFAAAVLGPRVVEGWVDTKGFRRRCALYVFHDQLGSDRLRMARCRTETAVWADAHHRPALWAATGLPAAVVIALAEADGEPTGGFGARDA